MFVLRLPFSPLFFSLHYFKRGICLLFIGIVRAIRIIKDVRSKRYIPQIYHFETSTECLYRQVPLATPGPSERKTKDFVESNREGESETGNHQLKSLRSQHSPRGAMSMLVPILHRLLLFSRYTLEYVLNRVTKKRKRPSHPGQSMA